MLQLNKLKKAGKKRKRIGRGGSRGGPSGRGFGGQKSRSGGGVGLVFEGGQMPITRRLPKRGFSRRRFDCEELIVNLGTLETNFNDGDIVTLENLKAKKIVKPSESRKSTLKILGSGEFKKKLTVHAHAWSKEAQRVIEKNGGQVIKVSGEVGGSV